MSTTTLKCRGICTSTSPVFTKQVIMCPNAASVIILQSGSWVHGGRQCKRVDRYYIYIYIYIYIHIYIYMYYAHTWAQIFHGFHCVDHSHQSHGRRGSRCTVCSTLCWQLRMLSAGQMFSLAPETTGNSAGSEPNTHQHQVFGRVFCKNCCIAGFIEIRPSKALT